jgi:hypothetical protein
MLTISARTTLSCTNHVHDYSRLKMPKPTRLHSVEVPTCYSCTHSQIWPACAPAERASSSVHINGEWVRPALVPSLTTLSVCVTLFNKPLISRSKLNGCLKKRDRRPYSPQNPPQGLAKSHVKTHGLCLCRRTILVWTMWLDIGPLPFYLLFYLGFSFMPFWASDRQINCTFCWLSPSCGMFFFVFVFKEMNIPLKLDSYCTFIPQL